jgi:predicted TIM-barrel fold metal-dependent hydrolase
MPRWAEWSAGDQLALMDRTGIRTSVLSVSAPGTHFGDDAAARQLTRQVNEAGRELVRRYPDRFAHFATLPFPDVEGVADRARTRLGRGRLGWNRLAQQCQRRLPG